jgi:hypothetical protein
MLAMLGTAFFAKSDGSINVRRSESGKARILSSLTLM